MTNKRLQLISIICLLISIAVELTEKEGLLDFGNQELPWGISLGLIIAALSFNVKVIRNLGAPQKERQQSQRLALIIAIYAFLVFALEVI